jgi:hypothetical protein
MVDVAAARAMRIYPIPTLERQANVAASAAAYSSGLSAD